MVQDLGGWGPFLIARSVVRYGGGGLVVLLWHNDLLPSAVAFPTLVGCVFVLPHALVWWTVRRRRGIHPG